MKKRFRLQLGEKNKFRLQLGEVEIHTHIHHPGELLWTCRKIGVFGDILCPDSVTDEDQLKELVCNQIDDRIIQMQNIRDRIKGIL